MQIGNDDIVTHLRAVANDSVYRADISVSRLEEAVDEIERWRHIAKELYTWLQPSPEDDSVYEAGVEAMTMYCEGVRGES